MQGGQGRGGGRSVYMGRGGGVTRGGGMGPAPIGYTGMTGFLYNNWGGYDNYHVQGMYMGPPPIRPPRSRGFAARPFVPLKVQGAGILKRPSVPPQVPSMQGRGHARGHSSRASGGRGRRNLTKEALDADLDEWRMKDKKFGGQSLDADLDEYWKKKDDDDDGDGEAQKKEYAVKDSDLETPKSMKTLPEEDASTISIVSATVVSHSNNDEESLKYARTD